MSEEKQNLVVDYHPDKSDENFRCGNSYFLDDVWDFKGFINAPHWNDAKFRLDFTGFNKWPYLQKTIKFYIVSELLTVGLNSVKRKLAAFNQLRKFIEKNVYVVSFKDFSRQVLILYYDYLLEATSERDGSLLNGQTIKKSAQVVKELLIRGGVRDWEVYHNTSYVAAIYQEKIIQSPRIKEDTKFGKSDKVLPEEELVEKIIELAQEEEEVLTGASIILQSQLGIRISEAVTIKEGCLIVIGGEMQIEYTTSKTKKEATKVLRPANELVVTAIKRLEEYTKTLREKSGMPYFFLDQDNEKKVVIASFSNWTKNRIKPFIAKHDIRDNTGKLLNLSSHYFRHIFATYALKKGMPIYDVAEMLNHESIQMTETYSHLEEHLKKVMVDVLSGDMPVSGTNKVVLEAIESEENPFKGKTTDQIEKMRKAMKIEILPHGLCLHHPLRGEPCAQDGVCLGCNNFLAPSNMLDQYESRLVRINRELNSTTEDDKNIYTSKLRYQAGRLEHYIKDLKSKTVNQQMFKVRQEAAVTVE
ncbi:hypothetical protein GCM10008018_37000 [Paenibacillus marchantiophytorum]|uniref:Tyr recombinase domain-containing protein n=1 Tax=Paenibacillus marchantiophytorum TaxID=1619310 RepID=A0ABQ1EUJ8_9BACL|nr:site-specific integrase [Paenibacillus marchantiophytorum]GFZ87353.1 hypothetical protein GCM10008018_37000 [Paenibacillus marchantiophytorum]